MNLPFVKMHAQGNDFVILDLDRLPSFELTPTRVKKIADRHFGLGCDQLLCISRRPERGHFDYRIFNQDGSSSEQCGNGARCLGKWLENEATEQGQVVLHTSHATMAVTQHHGLPSVAMPMPVWPEKRKIPFQYERHRYDLLPVSVGNPHVVVFVQKLEDPDLMIIGEKICNDPAFPQKTNVEFVKLLDHSNIRMRIYERGVGETLACGSGAVAAATLMIEQGLLYPQVGVAQPGGNVEVLWHERATPPLLRGSVTLVAEGTLLIN